jgi:nucleoside-diphosphate-sugar epimerase
MRIFVTGATGVIGRRVLLLLLEAGHAVTVLARQHGAPMVGGNVRTVTADLFDVAALTRAMAGHDAIVNLATHMPSPAWKMLFRRAWRINDRIRREGSANVADAATRVGAATLVQESFALTYPDRGDEWVEEDTALDPADYNRTVLDAERSVDRFVRSGGTGVCLRFAAFYGPDAIQVTGYIGALRRGWVGLPGGPDRFISSVAHDDAATAVVAALHAPSGAYTVTDDEPVRRADYFGWLAADLGVRPPRFVPDWATPLFGCAGETMARSLRLSNRKLRTATGWAPALASVREVWPVVLAQMNRAPRA